MALYQLGDDRPIVPSSAFVADEAMVIGKVTLGERASVWPGAVVRGDNEAIRIGAGSNVQDNAVLHTDPGFPLNIGANVIVGHQAMLHGCTIGDGALVGIQALVMNGAIIGNNCIVGAGAVVTEGKQFPDRSLIIGAPARRIRELDDASIVKIRAGAEGYVKHQEMYKAKLKLID